MADTAYASLKYVLDNALSQASEGKGKERHAEEGEPFEKQQIVEIGKRLQGNTAAGPLFQAVKKIYESGRLDDEKGIHELYGAINYIAAAIILRGGASKLPQQPASNFYDIKVAYVSTAHVTEEDDSELKCAAYHATLNNLDRPVAVSAYLTGYFVEIHSNWNNEHTVRADVTKSGISLSDDAIRLFSLLAKEKYDFVFLCADGETVYGLPEHEW